MIKDALTRCEGKNKPAGRLKSNSEAFDTLALNFEILQDEKNSLEAQETCISNLEQFNTVTVKKEKK